VHSPDDHALWGPSEARVVDQEVDLPPGHRLLDPRSGARLRTVGRDDEHVPGVQLRGQGLQPVLAAGDEDALEEVLAACAEVDAGPFETLLYGVRILAGAAGKDPEVKCAREQVLLQNPTLRARDLAQQLRWQDQAEEFLRERGADPGAASLAAGLALTVWREAYKRWISATAGRGVLGEFLDAVVGELPEHVLEPRKHRR